MTLPAAFTATPADSARVVGDVYGASLLITLPLVLALVACTLLRRSNAGARMLVWRCTMVLMLAVLAGRLVPYQWVAWVLPETLAWPLVTLGGVQLGRAEGAPAGSLSWPASALPLLVTVYLAGVAAVLLPLAVGRLRLARAQRRATVLDTPHWRTLLRDACGPVGVRPTSVRLVTSAAVSVPVTWGARHPVIMLPPDALRWPADRLRAVLLHELAHVRAWDALMLVAARLACAVYWFHPGAWWMAARCAADAEQACDERVLLSGIRRSDYAEWLAASVVRSHGGSLPAIALGRGRGLRHRLRAITDTGHRLAAPGRGAVLGVVIGTAAIMLPLSTLRVAPTRGVLTALMGDARWESRAWAVIRLAQRSDSVHVARAAASHDPDPAVRAWARYALSRSNGQPGSTGLH